MKFEAKINFSFILITPAFYKVQRYLSQKKKETIEQRKLLSSFHATFLSLVIVTNSQVKDPQERRNAINGSFFKKKSFLYNVLIVVYVPNLSINF